MYILMITLRAENPDRRKDMLYLLQTVIGPTQNKRDCLNANVVLDYEDEMTVTYFERWDSFEALTRHIQSPDFLNILLAIDMSSREPEVNFDEVVNEGGLDMLKQVRTAVGY